MKKNSIWLENLKESTQKQIDKDIEVDVLIVGGGITGLTTAYFLKDKNFFICLVDQDKVGHGVSSKTTGKLNYLQETIYSTLEKNYSYKIANLYYKSQRHAIKIVKDIIEKEKIDCNFEKVTSYVFTDKEEEVKKLIKEKAILESMGSKVDEHYSIPLKLNSMYAISVDNTAVFHPLKYLYALKNICLKHNIKIYEFTKIYNIKKEGNYYICDANDKKIKAKKVVLACHYPFFLFPLLFPIKTYLEKSYITASKVDENEKKTYITSKNPTHSIRFYEKENSYLIYLNNSHKICNDLNDKELFESSLNQANKLDLSPDYIWSNEDIMTYDKLPFIGKIKENMWIGTGYNTWGMTNGTIAAFLLSDLILDKENMYEELFSLKRKNLKNKVIGYSNNLFINLKGYIPNKIIKNKKWYPKSLTFTKKYGKSVAIYKEGSKEHIVYTKCPHVGCTLIFNEVEKTWDCPCHASKFNIDGKCIKGPSLYDISYKKKTDD